MAQTRGLKQLHLIIFLHMFDDLQLQPYSNDRCTVMWIELKKTQLTNILSTHAVYKMKAIYRMLDFKQIARHITDASYCLPNKLLWHDGECKEQNVFCLNCSCSYWSEYTGKTTLAEKILVITCWILGASDPLVLYATVRVAAVIPWSNGTARGDSYNSSSCSFSSMGQVESVLEATRTSDLTLITAYDMMLCSKTWNLPSIYGKHMKLLLRKLRQCVWQCTFFPH